MSDAWQPIETAPRDGTLLLLWLKSPIDRCYSSPDAAAYICIGYWGDHGGVLASDDAWMSVESREEIWGYGSEWTGPMSETANIPCNPSHWMPLPTPPHTNGG